MIDIPDSADLIRASRRAQRMGAPKSELRLWLEANFDELMANPPDWPALVARLQARGMKGAYKQKLTVSAAERAWGRLKAERAGAKPKSRPAVPNRETHPDTSEPFQIRSINKETT